MKIIIDGHGGYLCQASLEGTGIWVAGENIDEALGCLLFECQKELGIEVEILPCSTSAYERSWQMNDKECCENPT